MRFAHLWYFFSCSSCEPEYEGPAPPPHLMGLGINARKKLLAHYKVFVVNRQFYDIHFI